MYYGSGAGKLPTASAVVGDVVDAAKHLHKTIPTNWSNEPMHLMDLEEVEGRFFVRAMDVTATEAEEIFGEVQTVSLDNHPGEIEIVTSSMKQREYKEKAAKLGDRVLTMIRVKG